MEAITVPIPGFTVIFAGKNITQDITRNLISLQYKDSVKGESDEFTFTVEDKDGMWRGPWYPVKGDKMTLEIGTDRIMNCGTFAVDEVEVSGPPDVVQVKGLAAGTNTPMRSKNSQAYEGQTLRQIAQTIADKYGYTIVDGEVEVINRNIDFSDEKRRLRDVQLQASTALSFYRLIDVATAGHGIASSIRRKGRAGLSNDLEKAIDLVYFQSKGKKDGLAHLQAEDTKALKSTKQQFMNSVSVVYNHLANYTSTGTRQTSVLGGIKTKRVTQNRETDLAFLTRICSEYGILFSIRDTKMIFTSIYDVENGDPVLTIDRTELMRYSIKDKSTKSYKKVRIRHMDPATGKVVKKEVQSNDIGVPVDYDTAPDVLEIHVRSENLQQAEVKARAQLHHANTKNQEGTISVPGNILLLAGNNFILTNMGGLSGKYHIKSSTHSISSGGYTTELEVKRLDATSGVQGIVIGETQSDNSGGGTSFKREKEELGEIAVQAAAAVLFNSLLNAATKAKIVAKRIRSKGKPSQANLIEEVCKRVIAKSNGSTSVFSNNQQALKVAKNDFITTLAKVQKNL